MNDAAATRVVFVNRYFYPDLSATSQLLTDLALAMSKSGLRIEVICSRQYYGDSSVRLAPLECVGGVTVHRVWTTRFGRARLVGRALDYASFYCSSAAKMLYLLKRGDVLVVETDPPLMSIPALIVAKALGADHINWLQDIFPEVASLLGANPLPYALDALLRGCRNLSLRGARLNVVLGERMRQHLLSAGVPDERIDIIENWAEPSPSEPKPVEASLLRARLGLAGKFVIGYSGNLGRAHEFQTLLRAAELLSENSRFIFLMIGGGAGMTKLADDVSSKGLKNFRFLPYQHRESLADCLAAADVHWVSLIPALEGLIVPSKFYGILAAGRPVVFIGDADGELALEIRRGECGASVTIGESSQLSRLLLAWDADPVRRLRMGENGYRRYCERYTAARAFDKWTAILRRRSRVAGASSP